MRYQYIPGYSSITSPLTEDDQRPPPLQGTPAAGSPGIPYARPVPPENASHIERLIHELGSDDWTVCTDAQSALARMGSDPVDTLCEVLRTGAWNVRWRAAWVLGRIADISAVPPLCDALRDKYGHSWEWEMQTFVRKPYPNAGPMLILGTREQRALLRMEAAEALGRIGEPEAIPVLCGALWDGFEQVRERASLALAQIGDPAFEAVIEVVEGSGTEARVWAVRALNQMGDPAAIPILITALDDSYGGVRVAAAEGLGQLARKHPGVELRAAVPVLQRRLSPWALAHPERSAFTAALEVIEQSTAALRDLPLPAVAGSSANETLPLPAQPHAAEAGQLPVPSREAGRSESEGERQPGMMRRCARWLRERLR